MSRTRRLHYDDPLALEGRARVVAHGRWGDGAPSVVLDETLFYPESGGQMGDHGALEGAAGAARVIDVQLDEDGAVHHVIDGALPEVGAEVALRVDGRRRRAHMALHTGQHALSRALLDHLGAVTVSSRLGESACTIDVDVDGLGLGDLAPVQAAVNALIDEDRRVRQRFVDDDELEALSLRKPPPDAERVRVVDIEGYDVTPCGGTHATHTAQIELLLIQSVERYKGGSRITFEAGPRARRALLASHAQLAGAAAALRCAPPEVEGVVGSLQSKLAAAREQAGALRARLAEAWARALPMGERVVAEVDGGDPELLEAIAQRLATGARFVALAAPSDDGVHVVLRRGPEGQPDCGASLKAVAKACGGRGGGRPEVAQGKLPPGADLDALLRAHAG